MTGSSLYEKALRILDAALTEVDPINLLNKNIVRSEGKLMIQEKEYDLSAYDRIYLVAFGKAAPYMAEGMLQVLGDRIFEGIVLYLPESPAELKGMICLPASHPLPDERNLYAAQQIFMLAERMKEKDLLLVLISGGGSAQLCYPYDNVSLQEKRQITNDLLKAGADIIELNTVRKHLSKIKGGRLAEAAYPGTMISLVISDVINDDLSTIASGPTFWDSTTYQDTFQVLKNRGIWESTPASIKMAVHSGLHNRIKDTLKKGDPIFHKVFNHIIGSNKMALAAAKTSSEEMGFPATILSSTDKGEARVTAKTYIDLLRSLYEGKISDSLPACLLSGGELTVSVQGKGLGGRNQEFVLASVREIAAESLPFSNWLILSAGTDGIDGPTDAAGAWAEPQTLSKIEALSLDIDEYLNNNDSYSFFKRAGGLIKTGPTHTNVMDIRIFILE